MKNQNRSRSYISNSFKYILQNLKSRKDKGKAETISSPKDDFEEQLLFEYDEKGLNTGLQ